jgi:hypothetical protein
MRAAEIRSTSLFLGLRGVGIARIVGRGGVAPIAREADDLQLALTTGEWEERGGDEGEQTESCLHEERRGGLPSAKRRCHGDILVEGQREVAIEQ